MHDSELRLVHDLRNTAAVIQAAAQELQDGHQEMPPDVADRLTSMVRRRSEMLLRLLDDLALAHGLRPDELPVELQPVALDVLVREALPRRWNFEGTALTVDVEPGTVAHTDPTRITQILDNLVSNAARYGGPRIAIRGQRHGAWVQLHVEDDGPGVPPDIAPHIFDAYVRGPSSDQVGGKGLGLTIVRSLCEQLGGTVRYDAGERPRFEVRLPAVVAQPGPQSGPRSWATQPTPSRSWIGSIAK